MPEYLAHPNTRSVAVETPDGRVLVLAGASTGKTRAF